MVRDAEDGEAREASEAREDIEVRQWSKNNRNFHIISKKIFKILIAVDNIPCRTKKMWIRPAKPAVTWSSTPRRS